MGTRQATLFDSIQTYNTSARGGTPAGQYMNLQRHLSFSPCFHHDHLSPGQRLPSAPAPGGRRLGLHAGLGMPRKPVGVAPNRLHVSVPSAMALWAPGAQARWRAAMLDSAYVCASAPANLDRRRRTAKGAPALTV
jgi:hypothetical protein